MADKREQLRAYYDARFAYFQKNYAEFDPEVLETHLNVIRTSDMIWQALRAYLRPHGLTPPSMGALAMLDGAGAAMPMSRLSEQMVVTQANVTGIVDTLEKAGLVRRRRHAEDRRVTLVEITPAGHKKLKRFLPGQLRMVKRIYQDLAPQEHTGIRAALQKIREGLKRAGGLFALLLLCAGAAAEPAPLTLKDAVAAALAQHPSLASARAAYAQARAERWRVLGAFDTTLTGSLQHLDAKEPPSLFFQTPRTVTDSGSLGLSRRFLTGTRAAASAAVSRADDRPATAFNLNPRVQSDLDLSVTQPLLKGFAGRPDAAALRAADAAVRAARAQYRRAAEELALRAAEAYWALWTARAAVAVAEKSLAEAEEFLVTTRKLRQRYQAERDDLLRAEADVLGKELTVLEVKRRIDDAGERLRELLGAAEAPAGALDAPGEPAAPPELAAARAAALAARGDLAARLADAEREKIQLDGAAGLGLPELDVALGLGWTGLKRQPGESLGQLTRFGFRAWNIGLRFAYPFGAHADRGERLRLRAARDLAAARAQQLRRAIARDVALALRRLGFAGDRVRLQRRLQAMQDEILDLTSKKYRQGRVSSRDRLQAANAALTARSTFLEARAEWASARAAAEAAQGTLLKWLGLSAPQEPS